MHLRHRSRLETTAVRGRARALMPLAFAAAAVTLTAACGGAYGATSTPASSASDGAVAPASTELGTILVNGQGQTIYEFAADTGNTSNCDGGCATIWPPVIAPDPLPTSLPDVSGDIGSTTRTDGSKQLTIAGHPVYTYSGDTAPGDTNGQGLELNGGEWNVVSPAGSPVTDEASSSSSTY
jgi:predicted lipoprotein with Yx(FWY)xxD motif